MRFKLSIADYKGMIGFTIKSIIVMVLIIILAFSILNIISEIQIFNIVYLLLMFCFSILFILGIRKYFAKEDIELGRSFLISQQYGKISFDEIKSHKIQNYRGFTSLIISMQNGRKFSIGPRNNFTRKASEELNEFIEEFEKLRQTVVIKD